MNKLIRMIGIFQQQDVVAGGAFPVVEDITKASFTTNVTTHNLVLPATVNSGELLLVMIANDGNATVSATNFTQVGTALNGTAVRQTVLAKVATGSEGGTTVDFVTSAIEQAGVYCYRISNWGGSIANDIVYGTSSTSSTATQDPPSLTSGFGAVHTMWFAVVAASGTPTCATGNYPTGYGYSPNVSGNSGSIGSTASAMGLTSYKTSIAASEDPGAYTLNAASVGVAVTVALRGT